MGVVHNVSPRRLLDRLTTTVGELKYLHIEFHGKTMIEVNPFKLQNFLSDKCYLKG